MVEDLLVMKLKCLELLLMMLNSGIKKKTVKYKMHCHLTVGSRIKALLNVK